jgi:serine/threonine protein kinase
MTISTVRGQARGPSVNTRPGYGQLLTNELIDGGRYKIQSLIGTGGMGVVYSAKQVSMDRDVAIKLLQTKLTADEMMLKRFGQEALSVSRLRHPNIITIYDYGRTEDERLFMVMELLNGRSLHSCLQSRRFTSTDSLEILKQVSSAVAEAHRHHVVHRDLKPENIHLETVAGRDNFVKVLDFGIAKIIHGDGQRPLDEPVTQAGVVFGTPHYMSPEQVHGHTIDHRSDIYALGVLLFELISGQLPFEGCSNVEAMLAQVSRKFPDVSALCPDRVAICEIARLIAECTAKDPAQRVQTADAVIERIDELLPLVKDDLSLANRNHSNISATADTEYGSGEKDAQTSGSRDDVYDYNYTINQSEAASIKMPLTTSPPFTGQLNPTGTEEIPSPPRRSSWAILVVATSLLLGGWLILKAPQPPGQDRSSTPVSAAAQTKGTLFTLTSDPSEVGIFRDGIKIGVTPHTLIATSEVPSTIRFQLAGFHSAERQISINPQSKIEMAVTLESVKAWLRLESSPPGAQVFLSGGLVGVTPLELRPAVVESPFEVTLKLSGYGDMRQSIQLQRSGLKPHQIKLDLEQLEGIETPKVRTRKRSAAKKTKKIKLKTKTVAPQKKREPPPAAPASEEAVFDKL